jgi:hypothetical protein
MLLPLSTQLLDLLLSVTSGGLPCLYFSSLIATQTPPAPSAASLLIASWLKAHEHTILWPQC